MNASIAVCATSEFESLGRWGLLTAWNAQNDFSSSDMKLSSIDSGSGRAVLAP